jgi:hypothetical protein
MTLTLELGIGACADGYWWDANKNCVILPICGDGIVSAPETCDSGSADMVGCTDCQIDSGFSCNGAPSVCLRAACFDFTFQSDTVYYYEQSYLVQDSQRIVTYLSGRFDASFETTEVHYCFGSDFQLIALDSYGDGWGDGWFSVTNADTGEQLYRQRSVSGSQEIFPFVVVPCPAGFVADRFGECTVTVVCGDGVVSAPETCDTGQGASSPGCVDCRVTFGWYCQGAPSLCESLSCGGRVCLGVCESSSSYSWSSLSSTNCNQPCLPEYARYLGPECWLPADAGALQEWPALAQRFSFGDPRTLCEYPFTCSLGSGVESKVSLDIKIHPNNTI